MKYGTSAELTLNLSVQQYRIEDTKYLILVKNLSGTSFVGSFEIFQKADHSTVKNEL